MAIRVFTWNVQGSYLYYLSQGNFQLYVPVNNTRQEGYCGRGSKFPYGNNVIEIPMQDIKHQKFDCILYQSEKNYLIDQYEILTQAQRRLPRVYIEHNTPSKHAATSKHVADDGDLTLVHVTHFNKLMWHSHNSRIKVIEYGVMEPGVTYSGELPRGIAIINNVGTKQRAAGLDLFLEAAKDLPLDIAGPGTEPFGIGEIPFANLPQFISKYRFYFHPPRWTSLGLTLIESMMTGMPVVAVAATEVPTVIHNNISGFFDTNPDTLTQRMKVLINDHEVAFTMGKEAKKIALQRFNIRRFTSEWEQLFQSITQKQVHIAPSKSNKMKMA